MIGFVLGFGVAAGTFACIVLWAALRAAGRADHRAVGSPRTVTVDVSGPTTFEKYASAQERRQEHALSLLDDDVLAYALVRVRRTGACATVDLGLSVDDPYWHPVRETLARVVAEGDRTFAA